MSKIYKYEFKPNIEKINEIEELRNIEFGGRLILSRIDKIPNPFKVKQIQQKGWVGLSNTQDVKNSVNWLISKGYLKKIETKTRGRSAIEYMVLDKKDEKSNIDYEFLSEMIAEKIVNKLDKRLLDIELSLGLINE